MKVETRFSEEIMLHQSSANRFNLKRLRSKA